MAATTHGFPRSRRLLSAKDFSLVFAAPTRASDSYLTLLARPNGRTSGRIGFAIAKRAMRRAVDRNRVRRLVREDFRLRRQFLAGLDVVVMARGAAAEADRAVLGASLNRLWKLLLQRCGQPSSPSSGSIDSC